MSVCHCAGWNDWRCAFTLFRFEQRKQVKIKANESLIPVVCVVGSGVAGYKVLWLRLRRFAVWWVIHTVQQGACLESSPRRRDGTAAGYVAIFLARPVARFAKDKIADFAALSLFGMAVGGTLFCNYLTFLEPFVIGATCAWCLTSAVFITVLMLLSLQPAEIVFASLGFGTHSS